MLHFSTNLNLTSLSSSTIFQIAQRIMTMNGDRPRYGDHHNDFLNHNDNNPNVPVHPGNQPCCPNCLYRHYDDICPAGSSREIWKSVSWFLRYKENKNVHLFLNIHKLITFIPLLHTREETIVVCYY